MSSQATELWQQPALIRERDPEPAPVPEISEETVATVPVRADPLPVEDPMTPAEEVLGMLCETAVALWKDNGSPPIALSAWETCVDMEKMLSHKKLQRRWVVAIRDYLTKEVAK